MSKPNDDDRLLEHNYDGIQEYDNPLPGWWSLILWVCIAWALLYFLNVIPGLGTGKGRIASYEHDLAQAREQFGTPEQQALKAIDPAALEAAMADPAQMALGKATFASTCSPCHLPDGGGGIGPNLTDDYFIHGGTHKDILTTITLGVPDKGMPVWSAVLKPAQIAQVAAYVASLRGTHPAKAKEPQGVRVDAAGVPMEPPPAGAAAQKK